MPVIIHFLGPRAAPAVLRELRSLLQVQPPALLVLQALILLIVPQSVRAVRVVLTVQARVRPTASTAIQANIQILNMNICFL